MKNTGQVMRVAAYCRVSTDKLDQANSLESQQRYFDEYIARNPLWELYEIYVDEGITGTNTEKRETLTMLMTQGIIDPVLYSQETNELLSQADSFRDEIEALKNEVSGDVNKVTETTALIHFAEKSAMLQEFDKDLFDRYVKRIIVHSRNDIRFELKCGLTLRERK